MSCLVAYHTKADKDLPERQGWRQRRDWSGEFGFSDNGDVPNGLGIGFAVPDECGIAEGIVGLDVTNGLDSEKSSMLKALQNTELYFSIYL